MKYLFIVTSYCGRAIYQGNKSNY